MDSDLDHDLSLLRALMARELETINHYRSLAARAGEAEARDFFEHILEEEKLHVADVLRAIAQLDATQAHLLRAGFVAGHAPGQIPARPPAAGAAPAREARATAPRMGGLTIGSLRGMPQEGSFE